MTKSESSEHKDASKEELRGLIVFGLILLLTLLVNVIGNSSRRRKSNVKLIVGIIFISASVICYSYYFSGLPIHKSKGSCGIMVGYTNYHDVGEIIIGMTLNPDRKNILLDVKMVIYRVNNYSVAISLPYRVLNKELSQGEDLTIISRNADTGSVIMASFEVKQLIRNANDTRFQTTLDIHETIALNNLGSYSIDIPLGGKISPDVAREWNNLPNRIPMFDSGIKYNVYVYILSSSIEVQSSKPFQERSFYEAYQKLEYNLYDDESVDTIFITYKLPELLNMYQISFFLRGLFLSIGLPILMSHFFNKKPE